MYTPDGRANPLIGPFSEIERRAPQLVAVSSKGQLTGQVVDFCELLAESPHESHAL